MSIEQVIERLDSIRRNNFSKEQKTAWIAELEQRLRAELWQRYFEVEDRSLRYPEDKDAQIYIETPFHKLYLLYLLAQMDFYKGNLSGYNVCVRAYNMELQSYMSYLARSYRAIDQEK